jgi:hypothetical protein
MCRKMCLNFGAVAALWLFGVTGCTITSDGQQQAEVPLEEVFPPSKIVASYRQLEKPKKLTDDEMEEQLGNRQKLGILKKWSVMSSMGADYGIPKRPPKARVSVTEMSSKQNAYGAYTNLRPGLLSESNYIKIGVHATVEGERLLFVQDRFLIIVRDLSGAQDPARRTMLINFGRAISDRIPRDITDIMLVSYLPYENRIPATERLDKEDPLGIGVFKSGGVTALYRMDNRECKVFLAEITDTLGIKGALKDIKLAMEKEGPTSDLGIGAEGYQGRLFKSLAMLSTRERVVFGCYGTMTEKEMRNVMAGIDRRIKPYIPPKIKDKIGEDEDEAGKKKVPFGLGL